MALASFTSGCSDEEPIIETADATIPIAPLVFMTDDGLLKSIEDFDDVPYVTLTNTGTCWFCQTAGRMAPVDAVSPWEVTYVGVMGVVKMNAVKWACGGCGKMAEYSRGALAQLKCWSATHAAPATLFSNDFMSLVCSLEGANGSLSAIQQRSATERIVNGITIGID